MSKALAFHTRRRLIALVATVVGCGLLGYGLLRPAPTPTVEAMAPSFTAPLLDNSHPLSLRSLRGHPILLNFWGSYCAPCKDELPFLESVYRRYRARGVTVVGVDTADDTRAQAMAMVRRFGVTYPIVSDAKGSVTDLYDVQGTPTSVFIDAAGHMRGVVVGAVDQIKVTCGLDLPGANADACPISLLAAAATDGLQRDGRVQANAVFPSGTWHAHSFLLTDQEGRRVSLADLRGRVVALTFLSSVCREQCPLEGRQLARIQGLLGRDRARVAFVTISVQPETDMPAYAVAFQMEAGLDARWEYLTAPRPALTPIWRSFYVGVAPPPKPGQPATDPVHSLGLYLIDPRGDVRAYFDAPLPSHPAAAAIRALLSSR